MGRRAAVRALDRIVRLSEGSRTASTSSGARAFPNSATGHFGAQATPVVAPADSWSGSKANRSALAQPVEEVSAVPDTFVDAYGAVSIVSEEDAEFEDDVYRNIDGRRFEDGRYAAFINEISAFIPKSRQFTDPVRTFAYGTDASFYRLNPKLVVKVHNEAELQRILPIAEQLAVPVTFRAAGTSLSGQAITDSVLLKLSHTGKNFRNYEIHVSMALVCCSRVMQPVQNGLKPLCYQLCQSVLPKLCCVDVLLLCLMTSCLLNVCWQSLNRRCRFSGCVLQRRLHIVNCNHKI